MIMYVTFFKMLCKIILPEEGQYKQSTKQSRSGVVSVDITCSCSHCDITV